MLLYKNRFVCNNLKLLLAIFCKAWHTPYTKHCFAEMYYRSMTYKMGGVCHDCRYLRPLFRRQPARRIHRGPDSVEAPTVAKPTEGMSLAFRISAREELPALYRMTSGFNFMDLLDVQIALGVNGVAGLHQLRGDILQHRVRNDRFEGAAVAHRRKQAKKRQSPVSKDCRP